MRATSSRVPFRGLPWAALAGAVVLLMAGISAAFYEEAIYQSQRAQSTQGQAQILAASVAAALSFDDRKAAEEYVNPMQVNPEIAAAGIYAKNGALLTGFTRDRTRPLPRWVNRVSTSTNAGEVVVPVVQSGTALGWVFLRSSAEPPMARLSRYAVVVLFLAFMAITVVVGLGRAQGRLARQSERLAKTNEQLQQEIEERGRVEAALRQSQKMEALGQLSGGIAHDLNNHLMIIKGNLHLLKKRLSLADDDRHFVGAEEGIKRAAALTQRVLGFSRKQSLSPVEIDLSELLSGIQELIRSSLNENITVQCQFDARSHVLVDSNQMENIVLNIVVNARDAMPNGGWIRITTRDAILNDDGASGHFVLLEIADTGLGMPPEVQAKAFDPFFTTKPLGKGTGLGLSTAYGFVTQSGGQMRIQSAVGAGTSVMIYLPAIKSCANSAGNENG